MSNRIGPGLISRSRTDHSKVPQPQVDTSAGSLRVATRTCSPLPFTGRINPGCRRLLTSSARDGRRHPSSPSEASPSSTSGASRLGSITPRSLTGQRGNSTQKHASVFLRHFPKNTQHQLLRDPHRNLTKHPWAGCVRSGLYRETNSDWGPLPPILVVSLAIAEVPPPVGTHPRLATAPGHEGSASSPTVMMPPTVQAPTPMRHQQRLRHDHQPPKATGASP